MYSYTELTFTSVLSIHVESTFSSAACVMRTSPMVSYISSMISRQGLLVVLSHYPLNNYALDLNTYGGKSSFKLSLGGVRCFISEYGMYLLPLLSNLNSSSTETRNSRVDPILLCETFHTKFTDKLVNILGYTLINNNRLHSKGDGVAILLRDDIPYKKRSDISVLAEKEVESVYVEITAKIGSQILLGSLYRSLNTNTKPFTDRLEETINMTRTKNPNTDIILGMDHNLDLLKCDMHKATENFLDLMINREQWPTIT